MKVGSVVSYCVRTLGYSSDKGFGLYEIACRALEKEGYPKPENVGCKSWVKKNEQVVTKRSEIKIKRGSTVAEEIKNKNAKPRLRPSKSYVATDAFLKSFEWRKLRMEALKTYGSKCQCCGATPATGAVMNVDHIKPRKYYPNLALKIENLQVLCHECNHGKGNWDDTDWRDNDYFIKLPNL
jgi:5-methylcytosine-specific restriction endonuclease McrA